MFQVATLTVGRADILQPASTPTTLLPCGIAGDGSAVLNATDLHAGTSESSEGRLCAGTRGLGAVATCGSQLDVEGCDAKSLDLLSNVLGSQHSSVGRSLVAISLHLHATSHPADGLPAREVSDVNKGVVEGGEDVSNAEDELAVPDLRSQADLNLLLSFSLSLPGWHDLARPLL